VIFSDSGESEEAKTPGKAKRATTKKATAKKGLSEEGDCEDGHCKEDDCEEGPLRRRSLQRGRLPRRPPPRRRLRRRPAPRRLPPRRPRRRGPRRRRQLPRRRIGTCGKSERCSNSALGISDCVTECLVRVLRAIRVRTDSARFASTNIDLNLRCTDLHQKKLVVRHRKFRSPSSFARGISCGGSNTPNTVPTAAAAAR